MMKLIVAFFNFANATENRRLKICWYVVPCRLGLLDAEAASTKPPRNVDNFLPVDEAQYSTKFEKTGHGPHSSKLVVICVCSMYCLCVNVYCNTATG